MELINSAVALVGDMNAELLQSSNLSVNLHNQRRVIATVCCCVIVVIIVNYVFVYCMCFYYIACF